MTTPIETLSLVKTLLHRPIAFHRVFVQITGKITAALMLSQAYYWTPRANDEDGWFFKTRDEWQEETGLSRSEQESARKVLLQLGLLSEELRGMPARLHFRISTEKLMSLLAEIPPTDSRRKSRQAVGGKPASKAAEKPPTFLNTETTAEITTETTMTPPHRGTDFLIALRAFENSRKNMKKPITPDARRLLYKKLRTWDEITATEALENSVMNRWQGVFEPRNGNGHKNESVPPKRTITLKEKIEAERIH